MSTTLQLPPDVEAMTAEDVLRLVVHAFPGSAALACSFQKEETVLLDMLFAIEPKARVFALDTHYLFPETYELWAETSAATTRRSRSSRAGRSRTASGSRTRSSTSRSRSSSR